MARSCVFLFAFAWCACLGANAQQLAYLPEAPSAIVSSTPPSAPAPSPAAPPAQQLPLICPGAFPTDLTAFNCSFTQRDRWDNFLTSSITDEAILGSVVGALSSQIVHSPAEWPETWQYYGYRLASSYSGRVARGTVEFTIGSIMQSDPRHVRCADDPLLLNPRDASKKDSVDYGHCYGFKGQALYRPLHVFTDAFTVRRSNAYGNGRRLPAIERYVGVYAAAYASYPYEPQVENTFAAASRRAGLTYLFTFVGSAWSEYGPSITSRFHHTPTMQLPDTSTSTSTRTLP